MEGKNQPVDFKRVLAHSKANVVDREENALRGYEINELVSTVVGSKEFEQCSADYHKQIK